MDDIFAAPLRDAFPDRAVADLHGTGPSWNEANRTVGVEFTDGEQVYLKVATDGDGTRIARERAVIDYVGATTAVPVPTVAASAVDRAVPYLVTTPVGGAPLVEAWRETGDDGRAALARAVGRSLARVHDRRFDAHGHVVGGGADGLELETAAWTDVLVDTVEELRELAPCTRFAHYFDAVVEAVEANRAVLDEAPAALLHGDPAQPNCVRVDGDVGFLDWEIAHVGDPVRDVYRARDQQFAGLRDAGPERLVTAFHDGYREVAGGLPAGYATRRPVYEPIRLLGVAGYFERTAEFVDEDAETLAAWLREEMAQRLDALR